MKSAGRQDSLRRRLRKVQLWVRAHLPPGMRLVAGLVLIAAGVLGFLPVLGFWMIPLGVAVAALDVVPLWRRLQGRKKNDPDAPGK